MPISTLDVSGICRRLEVLLVEEFLGEALAVQFSGGKIPKLALSRETRAIKELSGAYLRGTPSINMLDRPDAVRAYGLYYLPVNFLKLVRVFAEISNNFENRKLSVLDYGCGPGTASLAAIAMTSVPMKFHLIDKSQANLAAAQRLIRRFTFGEARAIEMSARTGQAFGGSNYDIIIFSNVLNEMTYPERLALVRQAALNLSRKGVIVILEPALKQTAQQLMQLRDEILANSAGIAPVFPCTHAGICPMRALDAGDWCHGVLEPSFSPRELFPLVRQFDQLSGLNKHRTKYAALVLKAGGLPPGGLRILGMPKKAGKKVVRSCCDSRTLQDGSLDRAFEGELAKRIAKAKQFSRFEFPEK